MADNGRGMADGCLFRKLNGAGEDESRNRKETDDNRPSDDDVLNNDLINIMTTTSKIISLKVNDSDTVASVKLRIEDEECIPFDKQELIFNGMVLDNIHALANFGIKKASTLVLVRNPKGLMNISVIKLPEKKTYYLDVNPSDTIKKVRAKMFAMRSKTFASGHIDGMMIFKGIVLEDSATLADLNIINGSTLLCIARSDGLMELLVNTYHGVTIHVYVNPMDTISDVKLEIESSEGVPCDEQVLIFNNMVLGDDNTLFDFQINKKSELTLMRRSKGFMQIFIKTFTGEMITLQVSPSSTIADVKKEIEDAISDARISKEEMELIYKEMVLDNCATLADLHINHESTLTLTRLSTTISTTNQPSILFQNQRRER